MSTFALLSFERHVQSRFSWKRSTASSKSKLMIVTFASIHNVMWNEGFFQVAYRSFCIYGTMWWNFFITEATSFLSSIEPMFLGTGGPQIVRILSTQGIALVRKSVILSGGWFSTKTAIYDFWNFKVFLFAHFQNSKLLLGLFSQFYWVIHRVS